MELSDAQKSTFSESAVSDDEREDGTISDNQTNANSKCHII